MTVACKEVQVPDEVGGAKAVGVGESSRGGGEHYVGINPYVLKVV